MLPRLPGPRLADPPPRPDPRASGGGPARRRAVRTSAAARGRPATHPLFPPERRRTLPHARIPPESDADARDPPETGPESRWWEFLVTTTLGFAQWDRVFPSASGIAGTVDRLMHDATPVTIDGDSWRLRRGDG